MNGETEQAPELPDELRDKLLSALKRPGMRGVWRDFAVAEDEVLHDFYLDRYRKALARFPGKGNPLAWLLRSLRHYLIDRWRALRQSHQEPGAKRVFGARHEVSVGENSTLEVLEAHTQSSDSGSALFSPQLTFDDAEVLEAQRHQAVDCFSRLAVPDQNLVKQRVLKREPLVDIARREDLKPGTVRGRFNRALLWMKHCIQGRLRKPGRPPGSTSTRK